jgi:hypothetical protein
LLFLYFLSFLQRLCSFTERKFVSHVDSKMTEKGPGRAKARVRVLKRRALGGERWEMENLSAKENCCTL